MSKHHFERFESKFIHQNDCWIWQGSRGRYGTFYYKGTRWLAHRASYDMYVSEVPLDMRVLHKCDQPLCVNPKHLFLGTQQDNVDDMINKGRQAFGTNPARGSKCGTSVLNEEQVVEIKKLLNEGYSHTDISEVFDVARQTITNISTGHTWSWL